MSDDNIRFSQILATSVQDMKSSLTMLLSSLDVITEQFQNLDPTQQQAHTSLHYEAARLNAEIFQLQVLHKLLNDDLVPQVDEHYLIDILQEQLASCDSLLKTRAIEVELECDPDFNWYFDSELIASVVYKSLVNSARYSRGRVKISALEEQGQLLIDIADDGNGYPEFMLEQAHSEHLPENPKGTQLDFFCSRRIAQLHTKQPQQGSFTIANGGCYGGGVLQLRLP